MELKSEGASMPKSQPAVITTEMAELIVATRLAYVATVNPDGTANLSPKGSLKVLDSSHLGFANLASPNTIRNVNANGSVEINVLDPLTRRGFRFKGAATHTYDETVVDQVAGFLGPEFTVDGAVRVTVTSANAVWSPVYDCTDQSEESVVAEFRDYYGY